MRGDRWNDHEKLGPRKFHVQVNWPFLIRQVLLPIRLVKSPIWGLSKHNKASPTPDFSYPLVSSIFVPIFIHNLSFSILIAEHKVKSSLNISPWHDYALTLSTAYTEYSIHWVQHTPSTAYTEYSIHQIQHTPSIAYTEYSIHRVQHTPSSAYTEYSIHPRL